MNSKIPRCIIEGKEYQENEILHWELERSRLMLLKMKQLIGYERLKELFAAEVEESDKRWRKWVESSKGNLKLSSPVVIEFPDLSLKVFNPWFFASISKDPVDLDWQYRAHPDHAGFEKADKTHIKIFEVLGHKYGVSRFILEIKTTDDPLLTSRDPTYQHALVANVYLEDKTFVGKLLSEMKDTENGSLMSKHALYLPVDTDPEVISGHLNHLAVEYLNWKKNCKNETKV